MAPSHERLLIDYDTILTKCCFDVSEAGGYRWENMVLPLGILMLALALKFMGLEKQD